MLHTPVTLDDGNTVDVAASVGLATTDAIGSRDLSVLQRAADAALYEGKHSGQACEATRAHTAMPSINGRRAGRPGTAPPTSRVRRLTPELSKGLEFDLVVLIDPHTFGDGIEGAVDRYVAMTRATQRLVILTSS